MHKNITENNYIHVNVQNTDNSAHPDPGTPIKVHSNMLPRSICHLQCIMTKKDLNTNKHKLCILYTLL